MCFISQVLGTTILTELVSFSSFLDRVRKTSARVKEEDRGILPIPWALSSPRSLWVSVKRYVRKGIPLEHRARVWMAVSGAQAQMDQNPGYYHRLLEGEGSPSLEEAIRTGGKPVLSALGPCSLDGEGGLASFQEWSAILAQVLGTKEACLAKDTPADAMFGAEIKTKVFTGGTTDIYVTTGL